MSAMGASISLYSLCWILSYLILRVSYNSSRATYPANGGVLGRPSRRRPKIGAFGIIAIALIFTAYNWYVTSNEPMMSGDRTNYAMNFYQVRASPSRGLELMMSLVRPYTDDVNIFFYITTFICMVLLLVAYRISEDSTPGAMLLFFFSNGVFFSFTNEKQAYANALGAIFFSLMLLDRDGRSAGNNRMLDILSLALALISSQFHSVGFILFLLYFLLRKHERSRRVDIFIFLALVVIAFLEPILLAVSRLLGSIAPLLTSTIRSYFGDTATEQDSGGLGIVKIMPYLLIVIFGLLKRKTMREQINSYDNYLIVSLIGTVLYLCSFYNGWLSRFIGVFQLPMFIYFCQMMRHTVDKSTRVAQEVIVGASLAVTTYRFLALVYLLSGGAW